MVLRVFQQINWEAIAAISSAVIALAALIFSVRSFQSQESRAKRHAAAAARPILGIKTQRFMNRKAIILRNNGIGPAIIQRAEFSKSGVATDNIVELLNVDIVWEDFVNVPRRVALPPQAETTLVLATERHLLTQGFSEQEAMAKLREFDSEKSGIHVEIEYEDIFGNKQDPLVLDLK